MTSHARDHVYEDKSTSRDVAIIGLSCRFGGEASDVEGFWRMLCEGRDASGGRKTAQNGQHEAYYLRQSPWAFDANFFDISHREAKAIDPSHRLLLEVTYEAFENGGLSLESIAGSRTSCVVGQFVADYSHMLLRDAQSAPQHSATGINSSMTANRLSWFFDLRGSSETLNTACSSSMVALHAACETIRHGHADMAVAAGSNLILSPDMSIFMDNLSFLAPDGRCKAFDSAADGYGRGEGVAALVLRPLEAAVQAGDPIRAVIRGSGVNHNGRSNPRGITVPSATAQRTLIEDTYRSAGIGFDETAYVEAHGTGTKVGDPLELEAIASTLGRSQASVGRKLLVGSCKPNVGHTEASAGLAAVIKSVLVLEHGEIPPNILFGTPNPKIPFERWNISVPTKLTPWPHDGLRRISACSTGYGGTNAHVIIDDASSYLEQRGYAKVDHLASPTHLSKENGTISPALHPKLVVLRAHDRDGLTRQSESLSAWLARRIDDATTDNEQHLLRNLAFTLNTKRSHLRYTSYITASSSSGLQTALADHELILSRAQRSVSQPKNICFVFTGQGAQWPRMGMELYHSFEVFRASLDAAEMYLKKSLRCEWSVVEEISRADSTSRIHDPLFSQTLSTVIQVALVDLLQNWGITPSYIVGHSSGEIAGAYCRGAISKEGAWSIAYFRGMLSASIEKRGSGKGLKGRMLAVGLSPADAQRSIDEAGVARDVIIACMNAPKSVTLAGNAASILALERHLQAKSVAVRVLKVNMAYHSPHMEHIATEYFRAIRRFLPTDCDLERFMFSSLTGDLVEPLELGPRYFMDNLLYPVRFDSAVRSLLKHSNAGDNDSAIDVFVEIGPHSALRSPLKDIKKLTSSEPMLYTSVLLRGEDSVTSALSAAGFLQGLGVQIDSDKINEGIGSGLSPKMLVDLPPYSWDHTMSFKGLSRAEEQYEGISSHAGALLGTRCPTLIEGEYIWRRSIRPSQMKWLYEHEIDGVLLFPAAGYLVLILEAAQEIAAPGKSIDRFILRDFGLHTPLMIPKEGDIEINVQLRPRDTATRAKSSTPWMSVSICSSTSGKELRENCMGLLKVQYESPEGSAIANEWHASQDAIKKAHTALVKECFSEETEDTFYSRLIACGYQYGPSFRKVSNIRLGQSKAICNIKAQQWDDQKQQIIHPGTLDAMIHAMFAAFKFSEISPSSPMVPVSFDEVSVFAIGCENRASVEYAASVTVEKHGFHEAVGDVTVCDEDSMDLRIHFRGLRMRTTGSSNDAHTVPRDICTTIIWDPLPAEATKLGVHNRFIIVSRENPNTIISKLAARTQDTLETAGYSVEQATWPLNARELSEKRYIFLLDIDGETFLEPKPHDFETFQQIVMQCDSLLWLSMNDSAGTIVPGLARTVRNEWTEMSFSTLQIGPDSFDDISRLAQNVVKLACTLQPDMEVRETNGALLVPRLMVDDDMNTNLSAMNQNSDVIDEDIISSYDTSVKLAVRVPGDLSSICFSPQNQHGAIGMQADEVEIAVQASGVNFRDIMVAIGSIPDTTFGFDASGTVTAIGSDVTRFKVGDAVCALVNGAHSSRVRSREILTQAIPSGMSWEAACTLPLVLATAYNALVRIARAESGQSVLIHSGTGGVGQIAIQLAQMIGLKVFTTAGSDSKRELLQDHYGIEDQHILSSRDASFVQAINRMTSGRGVDIILNSLAGELLQQSWNCIAPGGTFVEIGSSDIYNNAGLDMRPFARSATFSFFDINRMMQDSPNIVGKLLKESFDLLRKGLLRPTEPLTSFPIASAAEAFRKMQAGKHMGKMALTWTSDSPVPILRKRRDKARLRKDATYLLPGGLGGVGRSVARLFVEMGARHICFISRSAKRTAPVIQMLNEFRDRGVSASVYKGDISDMASLQEVLALCKEEHPPISGIVQCAIVLQDSIFERMTAEQWQAGLRPKAQGSRNLDEALVDLDFFIMLSSFMGTVGNVSQSNYVAGCAFQDALAHERQARGNCPCSVALDLGIMKEVGFLAEHGTTGYLKQWEDHWGMREIDLHSLLRLAIAGETSPQVVTGMPTAMSASQNAISRPAFLDNPKFSIFVEQCWKGGKRDLSKNSGARAQGLEGDLASVASREEAQRIVAQRLSQKVAECLQMPESAIEVAKPLNSHGVDSLVAVELRGWILQQFKATMSTLDLTGGASIKTTVERIMKEGQMIPEAFRSGS